MAKTSPHFTFFDSYYKAGLRIKNKTERLAYYELIVKYGLYHTEPNCKECSTSALMAFDIIREIIDHGAEIATKRSAAGKKRRISTEYAEQNSEAKKSNGQQKTTKNNKISKSQQNETIRHDKTRNEMIGQESSSTPTRIDDDDSFKNFVQSPELVNIPPSLIRDIYDECKIRNWRDKNGELITRRTEYIRECAKNRLTAQFDNSQSTAATGTPQGNCELPMTDFSYYKQLIEPSTPQLPQK